MIKGRSWFCTLLVGLLLCTLMGFTVPSSPIGGVSDYAGVLSQEQKETIDLKLKSFYQRSSKQALVAILPTIEDAPIEDVAVSMFKTWGVGDQKRNDGILLILAIKQRKARIEVGYGSEADLPDQLAGRIIRDDLRPLLAAGDYSRAILVFEGRLEEVFLKDGGQALQNVAPPEPQANLLGLFAFIMVLLFLIRIINRSGHRRALTSRGGFYLGGLGGGGWGRSGGGGNDWFSGGGGISGGGGASGDW